MRRPAQPGLTMAFLEKRATTVTLSFSLAQTMRFRQSLQMPHCYHLEKSSEAVTIGPMGEKAVDAYLCNWPEQHPERFENAPLWLLKLIGGGLMIRPEHDCVGCRGFRSEAMPK
jgi:hypothetical protein